VLKQIDLTREGNYYFDAEGEPMVCTCFVSKVIPEETEEVTATISTDPLPNAVRILVTHGGFYRWGWEVPEWNNAGGMLLKTEELLSKIFPDAMEDGLDKPKPLWIQFSPK